jgi:hypothetical protein
MCPKKRRYADRDSIGSRLGFRVFQRFFELTTTAKNPKSFEDFIDSQYYTAFVKFGRHLAELNPINTDNFVDFVIKNSVKLKDWQKDYVYETYLVELMKKEPPERALERTMLFFTEWAEESGNNFNDFFRSATTQEAVYYLKTGKISPWVLYLAPSADGLMDRFNEEQYAMIEPIINPGIWTSRITKNQEDVKFIKTVLNEAGL